MQMWTGIVARTAPGWSLLVRAPANVPRRGGYEPFEGIIETDRWFGPLITNIRLTKTDVPIDFRADFPVAAGAADAARTHYEEATLNNYELVPRPDAAYARGLGRLLRYRGPAERAGRTGRGANTRAAARKRRASEGASRSDLTQRLRTTASVVAGCMRLIRASAPTGIMASASRSEIPASRSPCAISSRSVSRSSGVVA